MIRAKKSGAGRARHFLVWWAASALMLVTLAATFGFGALLVGYVGWIAWDPVQSFGAVWHPLVALPVGLVTAIAALWLFVWGVVILIRVVKSLRELVAQGNLPT